MVTTEPMNHDDDVEHLFSWLQTPELRYREFAGAREITDTVIVGRTGPNSETLVNQDVGENQDTRENQDVAIVVELTADEASAPPERLPVPADVDGTFLPEASGRGSLRRAHYEEPAMRPPMAEVPDPPTPPARLAAAVNGGGLLGGAYRGNGVNGHGAGSGAPARTDRALDAVFGRLAGGRGSLPDPRDRLRHIPVFRPPNGRSR
jgi:hypothetical protein